MTVLERCYAESAEYAGRTGLHFKNQFDDVRRFTTVMLFSVIGGALANRSASQKYDSSFGQGSRDLASTIADLGKARQDQIEDIDEVEAALNKGGMIGEYNADPAIRFFTRRDLNGVINQYVVMECICSATELWYAMGASGLSKNDAARKLVGNGDQMNKIQRIGFDKFVVTDAQEFIPLH